MDEPTWCGYTERMRLGDWPDELPALSRAAYDQVERWTRQRLLVFYGGAWVDASEVPDEALDGDGLYPTPMQPRMWAGCYLQGGGLGWYLVCRQGVPRTHWLRFTPGNYSDLLCRAALTAEVLGPGALPDLRAAVSLAFGLGLLFWVEPPTPLARG
jgi:hypothetical protein